jgi:hypothetical protein
MHRSIIRICYRKLIDANAVTAWDKLVFDDSYADFLMQAQYFNREKKYTSFGGLVNNVPGAEKLHSLVSASITGYLKQLNGKIPDIVNNQGKVFLPFKNYMFEIINSDTVNRGRHQVAIHFYTEPLVWHSTIGNLLLVSACGAGENTNGEILTDMFALQPFVSIYSISEMQPPC